MPPLSHPAFVRLDGATTTLIIDCRGISPAILHWGPKLHAEADPLVIAQVGTKDPAPCSPDVMAPLALTPQIGEGFPGRPGLRAHRNGQGWATYAQIDTISISEGAISIVSRDRANRLRIEHNLALDPALDVLKASTTLVNEGDEVLIVDWCAAPTLPLPSAVTHITSLEGRWAGEFQLRTVERGPGALVRENRRGRTSHDAFPAMLAETAPLGEAVGEIYGLHLAWSGNHSVAVETLSDGRAFVQMGELFMPGELRLAPDASYRSPDIVAAFSDRGRSGLSRAFHAYLRKRHQHARLRAKPRPVHYNTWEAVYFEHDPQVLTALADAAADVGAERFVLDDGWFKGRRSDRAGLGDWLVDEAIYPHGLSPLIDHVRGLGLEFGLWVEPEMVNPDSDLFRAHPEWVLGTPPAPQLGFRNQLVLDFGRAEVRAFLSDRLHALLDAYPISYLKWDMNRDVSHPGGADGSAGAHAHVLGLYDVLARLRAAHPSVEIESCSAGGGRADFAILDLTDRLWTSDSNDALDRLTIQKGLSLFVPAELMGAHVGPADCHITGRRIDMATRVATAMFGHFGIEANLLALTAEEKALLTAGTALHKRRRALIHSGELYRLDRPANEVAFGIVAQDQSEALFSFTMLSEPLAYFGGDLRLAGLDPHARYNVTLDWGPAAQRKPSPLLDTLRAGLTVTGDILMRHGLQPPRLGPQSNVILYLQRIG